MKKYLLLMTLSIHAVTMCAQGLAIDIGKRSEDSLRVTNMSIGVIHYADSLKGAQMNVVSNMARSMKGVQLSGVTNIATTPFQGFQLAGITNIAMGVEKGTQLSTLLNISSGYMRGAQLGAYNYADSLNGSQLGIINIARSHPKGWQVGLVNITRDTIAHKIGLINVNPNTEIDFVAFGGNRTKLNMGVRFRNRSTYNVIGFGTHYMGLDEKFSGALYYRLGQYFRVNGRWSLSGDMGYSHIETFEQNSTNKPERLFALQARLNVDYAINKRLGAFVSLGYEDTRYYQRARHYRNGMIIEGGLTLRYQRREPHSYKTALTDDGLTYGEMAAMVGGEKPRPWLAALEATGINVFVHSFDRFILGEDFAKTTLRTMRHNLEYGFVWDNDQFATNLFAHPYHGNLYFNAARSNGLNFWQSAPYALGGSLMWEFFGEIEPAAINDLVATTMGGICIGEVTHRISDAILNDRTRGFNRFLREAAATIIDPMKGLNRITSGKAWRIRNEDYLYHDGQQFPIGFSASLGNRYLADDGGIFRGEHNPYINIYLRYGDALNRNGSNKPYDFFDAEVTFGLSKNQPLINQLNLLGRIWSTPMMEGKYLNTEFGFYQHFNYYDSKPVKDGTSLTPYRISEAAALGPGIIMEFPEVGSLSRLEQRLFLSGILLGGTKSDYYNIIDRDYNMGSGFSIKSKTHMELRHFGRFILKANYFQLYTWKGYEQKDLSTVNPLYLNAQGDRGNSKLLVINPISEFDVTDRLSLVLAASYYVRNTHYKYYSNVRASTFELKAGLTCHF